MDLWKKVIPLAALRRILLLIFAAGAGLGLLYVVFLLPVDAMMGHAKESSKVLSEEGFYPVKWGEEIGSTLDNFTDALMIQNAVHPVSEHVLQDALRVNHMQYTGDMRPVTDLEVYVSGAEGGVPSEYARYWHGYLIFLKPLLLVMSYAQIRILNLLLQIFLFVFLLWSMKKAGLGVYVLPFVVAWLGIAPWVLPYSMQFSSMYYFSVGGSILLLRYYDKIMKYKYLYFMVLGICTAYFDYLTWPVITLGLPLTFFALMEKSDLKTTLVRLSGLCMNWAIGYAGMWGLKWVLGEMILQDGTLSKAIGAARYRASNDADGIEVSLVMMWKEVIRRIFNPAFLVACAAYGAYLLLRITRKFREGKEQIRIARGIPFLLIACLPLVWYAFTRNHSYIHLSLVYRGLWISAFAGLCAIVDIFLCDERKTAGREN